MIKLEDVKYAFQKVDKMKVYLDNGATTKTASEVVEAMLPYFSEKYGNASSLHQLGQEAKEALERAREAIAKKINADTSELVFTSGGSESDNLAIKGIAYKYREKGNHIITSKIEHPAVLSTCKELEKDGFEITYLGVDKEGFVKLDELEKAIRKETILITLIHANNEIGTVQPIKEIGEIAKKHHVFLHTDAVQSFTKVAIDVKEVNVDLISMSSHKIHGPNGIGALYIKKGVKLHKQMHGGHHEHDIRAGTENIPGAIGFAKAVEISNTADIEKMTKLRDDLIKQIEDEIPDVKFNGSRTERLCNNVSIAFKYVEGESMLFHLDSKGIAVSTGSACSSQSLTPSHVLLAIGLPHEIAHGTIRLTLSKYTTKEEIDYAVKNLKEIVANLRRISPLTK